LSVFKCLVNSGATSVSKYLYIGSNTSVRSTHVQHPV
jgi:hypothetical protein